MKKLYFLCLAALAVFTFSACSDDDDSGSSASSNSIVGTWEMVGITDFGVFYEQEEGCYEELTLTGDNRFSLKVKENNTSFWSRGMYTYDSATGHLALHVSETNSPYEIGEVYSYTATLSGNMLTLTYSNGDYALYKRIR